MVNSKPSQEPAVHEKLLTSEQVAELKGEMVSMKEAAVVRFQVGGRCLNISSGYLQPRGINVLHQTAYWCFTRETALKIAGWLDAKAIFD